MILWSIPGKNSWVGVWALMNRMVLPLSGRYNQCQKDSLKNQLLHGSGHSSRLIVQQPSVRNRALHPWWLLHVETFYCFNTGLYSGRCLTMLDWNWLLQWKVLIKPCALLDFAYIFPWTRNQLLRQHDIFRPIIENSIQCYSSTHLSA